MKLGAPCSGFTLAATAPLAPAPAPRSVPADATGATWATVRGAFGEVSLGLVEESYDPVLTGGYTEEELKADWGEVGTGGLRPHRCFHLISRVFGVDDQQVMLPDPYACGEGD